MGDWEKRAPTRSTPDGTELKILGEPPAEPVLQLFWRNGSYCRAVLRADDRAWLREQLAAFDPPRPVDHRLHDLSPHTLEQLKAWQEIRATAAGVKTYPDQYDLTLPLRMALDELAAKALAPPAAPALKVAVVMVNDGVKCVELFHPEVEDEQAIRNRHYQEQVTDFLKRKPGANPQDHFLDVGFVHVHVFEVKS